MGKKKTKYSVEFKLNAVSRMVHAKTISGLAKELGVRRRFLYEWRNKPAAGGRAALGEVWLTDGASWTHDRTLLRVDNDQARQWYMREAASQSWTTRALERQTGTLHHERLLSSSGRTAVEQEAGSNLTSLQQVPREFIRDPVMLEFLGLSGTGKLLDPDLEQALLDNLQAFLLELGRGFAFVARQLRISNESKDFHIDKPGVSGSFLTSSPTITQKE